MKVLEIANKKWNTTAELEMSIFWLNVKNNQ